MCIDVCIVRVMCVYGFQSDGCVLMCVLSLLVISYEVALVSRVDQIIGLLAKEPYKREYSLQKRPVNL